MSGIKKWFNTAKMTTFDVHQNKKNRKGNHSSMPYNPKTNTFDPPVMICKKCGRQFTSWKGRQYCKDCREKYGVTDEGSPEAKKIRLL